MAAQYRSHSVGDYADLSAGALPSVPKPAGVIAGDLLILFVSGYQNNTALTITWPSGFTEVTADNFTTTTPDGVTGRWAWKIATGSEPSTYGDGLTINTNTLNEAELNMVCISGVDTSSPITNSVVTTNGSYTNTTPISMAFSQVNPNAGDCVIWYGVTDNMNSTDVWTISPPSGYTERFEHVQGWTTAALATLDNTSAGATGTLTGTATRTSGTTNAGFNGWAIAVKSAAGSGPVTVGLTGQALTISRGTIGYSSGGNISVAISTTGISSTISHGSLKANIDKVIPNTSNVATTSLQTLPTKSISRVLPGQNITISQTTPSASSGSARSAQLGGISNTISSGILKANISRPLVTNLVTTNTGTVTRSGSGTTIALTGSQITASPGTVKASRTRILVGQNTLIVTAQVIQASGGKSRTVGLFGQSTYTLIGNITPNYIAPKRGVLSIQNDVQSLAPDALVDLFELDTTRYAGGTIYRFHADVNSISTNVVWQTNTYEPFPIEVTGFESSGTGSPARPKVRVANISGYIGALTLSMNDLVGCKFTRKRTFAKYLDATNFIGGVNATADINAHFPDEIFYIDRKASENNLIVEFELASVLDMNGILLPRRDVVRNNCAWKYKSAECGYAGAAAADEYDNLCIAKGGSIPNTLDKCGKRFTSCEIRFGTATLPFGAFPAVGLVR